MALTKIEPTPPKKKNPLLILIVVAVLAAGGYYGYKHLTKPEPVMDITYGSGPATSDGSGSQTSSSTRKRVSLDSVYAKAQLDFVGSGKQMDEVMNAPASEVIEELNEFGLSREELLTSVANLLKRIDDDLQSKNMITTYIVSLQFKVNGNELIMLLQAADIADDFYYSNVIKSISEFIQYPLSNEQVNLILEPIGDFDSRIRSATNLEKERMRAEGKYFD